jgi:hypothetical protein
MALCSVETHQLEVPALSFKYCLQALLLKLASAYQVYNLLKTEGQGILAQMSRQRHCILPDAKIQSHGQFSEIIVPD